jgi:hypothetical protein
MQADLSFLIFGKSDRQEPDSALKRIDRHDSAGLEVLARGMQRIHDKMANCGGKNVLGSDLNDARSATSL